MQSRSRKDLITIYGGTAQKLSRIIKTLLSDWIVLENLECNGEFSLLGWDYMCELLELVPTNGDALGIVRKRWIKAQKDSPKYAPLYKGFAPVVEEPETVETVDVSLDSAIARYEVGQMSRQDEILEVPDFLQITKSPLMEGIERGLSAVIYHQVFNAASRVAAQAVNHALADVSAGLADQMAYQIESQL